MSEDGVPATSSVHREVNGVHVPLDAVILEEGASVAGPYVVWYLPFNRGGGGWLGEPAVLVFASTPLETGRGIILKRSSVETLLGACRTHPADCAGQHEPVRGGRCLDAQGRAL